MMWLITLPVWSRTEPPLVSTPDETTCSPRPRPCRTAKPLGCNSSPAPTSAGSADRSTRVTAAPARASSSAAVRPPIPPPATRTVRVLMANSCLHGESTVIRDWMSLTCRPSAHQRVTPPGGPYHYPGDVRTAPGEVGGWTPAPTSAPPAL